MNDVAAPTYDETIAFYTRDDVSTVLWELSRRRPLKFHYYSDVDFTSHGLKAKAIGLHCLGSRDEFRERVLSASRRFSDPATKFFPFFGMGSAANAPGQADRVIGWDMRFEFDFDLAASFRALIPVMAVLEHFCLPYLAKFSGHRSLHLILPAEAFPERMRESPDKSEWMAAFEMLGALFCRIAPDLTRTGASHLAKDLVLTAPYSLHRYNGLVGIPLSLSEAMDFDPASAVIERVTSVSWRPESMEAGDDRLDELLAIARNVDGPRAATELAKRVYRGEQWDGYIADQVGTDAEGDAAFRALMVGLPAVNCPITSLESSAEVAERLPQALGIVDSPEAKGSRFQRTIGQLGFVTGRDTMLSIRETVADALAVWVRGGLGPVVPYLLAKASDEALEAPVAFAVRMLSFLPERSSDVMRSLEETWDGLPTEPEPAQLFVALAAAELMSAGGVGLATPMAPGVSDDRKVLANDLLNARPWRTEEHPDMAVKALAVSFGPDRVRSWLGSAGSGEGVTVVDAVFGGNERKFVYAARKALPTD